MKVSLKVSGMTCNMCTRHVTQAIESVSGTCQVMVDLGSGIATLDSGSASIEAIIKAVQEEGYQAQEA